ncbi:MAG: FHA domain-containing protein [Candidatus Caenarcaniphilales bacterium]|nr:FHA domain-containing protein [Candidatus Caenarcaniphilales bacterium]
MQGVNQIQPLVSCGFNNINIRSSSRNKTLTRTRQIGKAQSFHSSHRQRESQIFGSLRVVRVDPQGRILEVFPNNGKVNSHYTREFNSKLEQLPNLSKLIVGREPQGSGYKWALPNDVSPYMSRTQFEIEKDRNGNYFLVHKSQTNGTVVNGEIWNDQDQKIQLIRGFILNFHNDFSIRFAPNDAKAIKTVGKTNSDIGPNGAELIQLGKPSKSEYPLNTIILSSVVRGFGEPKTQIGKDKIGFRYDTINLEIAKFIQNNYRKIQIYVLDDNVASPIRSVDEITVGNDGSKELNIVYFGGIAIIPTQVERRHHIRRPNKQEAFKEVEKLQNKQLRQNKSNLIYTVDSPLLVDYFELNSPGFQAYRDSVKVFFHSNDVLKIFKKGATDWQIVKKAEIGSSFDLQPGDSILANEKASFLVVRDNLDGQLMFQVVNYP